MNFEFLNGKNFDISKLKAGLKINSDNEVFKKYDQNNNSIWDREELAKFHSDIDSYIQDGKLDETEAASFFANVMGLTLDAAKKILNSKENKLIKSFEILQNELDSIENDEALAVIDMQNEINSALEVFETAKKGPASTVANGFKELFNTKYAGNKVYRQLMEKQVVANMLQTSCGGQGIPAKEYMQKKVDLFKFLIGGETGISDKEFKNILESVTPYEMQMYINKLVNADDKEYSSIRESIVREIKAKNVNRNNDQIRVNISNQTSVQYLLDNYKAEEILTFEEIYLHELGVPFDPEKINEYRQKEKETQIIMYTFNKINGVCEKLKSAYIVLDDIQRNGMPDTPIGNEEEFFKRQTASLKSVIVESLQEIYGNNQDKINNFIAELGYDNIKFENGELVFSGLYSEQNLLINLAKSIEAKLKRNFNENILHGKTLDDVTKELEETHKNAFGNHNPINLAGEFEKSQETGVEIIKFGTMAGALILTAGSGSILVTAAGVAVATISGTAIDAAEMKSKKGTLSDDDKKGLLKELTTSAAYIPVGMGIGALSTKIASQFPKLLQTVAMFGSDMVMSCLADYIITGELDLSYETLSELLNIATMIVAHRKISNGKTNSTKHETSSEGPNTPAQEPKTKPEMADNSSKKPVEQNPAEGSRTQDGRIETKETPENTPQKNQEFISGKPDVRMESGAQGRQYYEEKLEPNKPVRLDEVEGLILDANGNCVVDFNNPEIKWALENIKNRPAGEEYGMILGRFDGTYPKESYIKYFPDIPQNSMISRKHVVVYKGTDGKIYIKDCSTYGTIAIKVKEQSPAINLKKGDYETLDGVTDIILAGEYRLDLSNYTDYLNRMPEGAYITVGRSSKCDIVVPEKYNHVSGQHLMIIKRNGKIYIKDISTNGTTVYKQTGGNNYNNIKADTPAKSRLLEASGGDQRLLSKMVQVFGKDEAYIDKIASTLNSNNKVILETYLNNPNAVRNGSRSVTKDDLAILMMFNRNNTGSYNLISNPYEVKNFLQRAYNEIDNLARSYGYKNYCNNREVRDAILYGETRFKGTMVECSPNHNILNDMENLIHGLDYIKHFRSVNEAIYNTQVGDAVTINGRMYVNDGRQMVPLQLSEQRFRQLFPPMQRFACHQGEVGDCYLVATIDAMANSGYGRAKLYQMIGEDYNGIYTTCANGNGQKTYFPRFTTKNKNMYDGNGLAIIEAGYCQNSRGNAFNPSMTMIMERNEGGWGLEAYHSLTGNSNMTYHSTDSDRNAVINIIKNAAGREDVIIYAGSKKVDNRGHNIALDPKYDVHQGHAYCVKGYDAVTDCVLISNPWHSGVEIKIPMNRFLELFDSIQVADLK